MILYTYWLVLRITFLSFGGAYSIWALLGNEVAVDCSSDVRTPQTTAATDLRVCRNEFNAIFGLAEILPGPQVNSISMLAYRQFGVAGMFMVLMGLLTPGLVMVPVLSRIYERFRGNEFVQKFFIGALIATLAILGVFFAQIVRPFFTAEGLRPLILCTVSVGAFFLSYRFKINPVFLVGGGAVAGYLFL